MIEKLTVQTDDLGVLELEISTVAEFESQDSQACRIFTIASVDGMDFLAFATGELLDEWAKDDPRYHELKLLVWQHTMVPNKDRRKNREFDPRTFKRCESLRSLTAATRTEDASLTGQLYAFADTDARLDATR